MWRILLCEPSQGSAEAAVSAGTPKHLVVYVLWPEEAPTAHSGAMQ